MWSPAGCPPDTCGGHLADGAAFVYDADLTTEALDREVACEVATAMAGRARLDGAGEIRMNVVSGDAAAAALAREWGCQPAATQMRRRLEVVGSDPEVADGPVVRLRSMTSDEVTVFLAGQRADYAAELLASRTAASVADAAARADEELTGLLGDGPALARQTLLSVDSQLGPVGSLWLEVADTDVGSRAFVYDLVIAETQRRRGYGQAAMRALEDHCRARGVTVIALSVFGHNIPARRLYDQLGYKATEDLVHVRLDPPDPPDPPTHTATRTTTVRGRTPRPGGRPIDTSDPRPTKRDPERPDGTRSRGVETIGFGTVGAVLSQSCQNPAHHRRTVPPRAPRGRSAPCGARH